MCMKHSLNTLIQTRVSNKKSYGYLTVQRLVQKSKQWIHIKTQPPTDVGASGRGLYPLTMRSQVRNRWEWKKQRLESFPYKGPDPDPIELVADRKTDTDTCGL